MSYRLVRQLQQEAVPVTQACRLLQINRAGYYQHWQRSTQAADIVTTVHLKAAFTASGSTYGVVVWSLPCRLKGSLLALSSTTPDAGSCIAPGVETQVYPHHRQQACLPIAENLLDRKFEPALPNLAWVSDITYVRTRFFLNLKMERVWQQDYASQGEAQRDIADHIVRFYNGIRLHTKLGYLSPAAYKRKMAAIPPIPVSEMI